MSNVLIVASHPDDETLGCGGTILKHKSNGDKIYWLIITSILEGEGYSKTAVDTRDAEIREVPELYKFEDVFKLDLPTTKLDTIPKGKLIESVSEVINTIKPEIIYVNNRNDIHSDHKIIFDAVISSAKIFRCPFIRKIMMYEVISETEFAPAYLNNAFSPNSFSDISNYLDKKISIMRIYKGEMKNHPFPRSEENLRALATFRGATAGVKYAEAFMVSKGNLVKIPSQKAE